MNEVPESRKIASLGPRLAPSSEQVGQLLNGVRNIVSQRLQRWVSNAFEQVDDALFDLAEKAENNAAQMHYFDGMRDVRKRRPAAERHFMATVSRQLGELAHPRAPEETTRAATSGVPVELSLVAETELEESLAITSMISKNDARLSRDLFAVNQRLSVICGGHTVDDTNNPIAPSMLSQAFRQSLGELGTDMRVKLIIYKLFDRYVLSSLDELYREINAELAAAGVLPQIRQEVAHVGAVDAPAKHAKQTAAAPHADAAATESVELNSDLLETLQTLLSARRQPTAAMDASANFRSGGGDGAASGQPLPSAHELLGALSVLQSQIASASQLSTTPHAADIGRDVLQLKGQLLNQIGALRGERPSHVATIDDDTIDLVGMLFEFILEDRNLPAEMQALLVRLQIPYLKAT